MSKNSTNTTLDVIYNKKIKQFEKEQNKIPRYKNELNKYIKEFELIKNKNSSEYNTEDIKRKSFLKTKIDELQDKIYSIEKNLDELEFYEKSIDIIDAYYDILNKDKTQEYKKKISIIDVFNKKKTETDRVQLYNDFILIAENEDRRKIYNFVKKCQECNTELIIHHSEGRYTCTNCGISEEIIIDSDKPNYKDPVPDKKTYAYKRINHFNEWLSQVQGKESTHIPDDIYDDILKELQKNRFTDLSKLDQEKIQNILKKLGLSKYKEHTMHIINKLTGIPPPNFPREIEDKLKIMFKETQEPYAAHKLPERKNFLSYSYILHKFCQLLELDEYLKYFKLLKSTEKLRNQDKIWKKICEDLEWEFIPSI